MSLSIRHQDPHIVVVEKPYGLPSQGTQDVTQDHLFAQVKARFPRAALHHRLDTPASGLVLFTVHPSANKGIAEAFRKRRITRRYSQWSLAIRVPRGQGSRRWMKRPPSLTSSDWGQRRNGAAGGPHRDGRTHQIRRHAAMAGHQLGDRRHGVGWGWTVLHRMQ